MLEADWWLRVVTLVVGPGSLSVSQEGPKSSQGPQERSGGSHEVPPSSQDLGQEVNT